MFVIILFRKQKFRVEGVDQDNSILELQSRIEKECNVPVAAQQLISKGKKLHLQKTDDTTLGDLNIKSGQKIMLMSTESTGAVAKPKNQKPTTVVQTIGSSTTAVVAQSNGSLDFKTPSFGPDQDWILAVFNKTRSPILIQPDMDLKEEISNVCGVPASRQRLVYKGKMVTNAADIVSSGQPAGRKVLIFGTATHYSVQDAEKWIDDHVRPELEEWEGEIDRWHRQKQRNFFNYEDLVIECSELQDRIQLRLHDLKHAKDGGRRHQQYADFIARLEAALARLEELRSFK